MGGNDALMYGMNSSGAGTVDSAITITRARLSRTPSNAHCLWFVAFVVKKLRRFTGADSRFRSPRRNYQHSCKAVAHASSRTSRDESFEDSTMKTTAIPISRPWLASQSGLAVRRPAHRLFALSMPYLFVLVAALFGS